MKWFLDTSFTYVFSCLATLLTLCAVTNIPAYAPKPICSWGQHGGATWIISWGTCLGGICFWWLVTSTAVSHICRRSQARHPSDGILKMSRAQSILIWVLSQTWSNNMVSLCWTLGTRHWVLAMSIRDQVAELTLHWRAWQALMEMLSVYSIYGMLLSCIVAPGGMPRCFSLWSGIGSAAPHSIKQGRSPCDKEWRPARPSLQGLRSGPTLSMRPHSWLISVMLRPRPQEPLTLTNCIRQCNHFFIAVLPFPSRFLCNNHGSKPKSSLWTNGNISKGWRPYKKSLCWGFSGRGFMGSGSRHFQDVTADMPEHWEPWNFRT